MITAEPMACVLPAESSQPRPEEPGVPCAAQRSDCTRMPPDSADGIKGSALIAGRNPLYRAI